MIICKMTYVIQGILPSHYLCNVNFGNYGLSHVPKSVTPQCVFTLLQPLMMVLDVNMDIPNLVEMEWILSAHVILVK